MENLCTCRIDKTTRILPIAKHFVKSGQSCEQTFYKIFKHGYNFLPILVSTSSLFTWTSSLLNEEIEILLKVALNTIKPKQTKLIQFSISLYKYFTKS